MRLLLIVATFFAFGHGPDFIAQEKTPLRIGVEPKTVWIERAANAQTVSFDFLIENTGPTALRIARIELSVYDRRGDLQLRKFTTATGAKHGDYAIASVAPNSSIFLFSPFESFAPDIDLARLRYEFVMAPDTGGAEFSSWATVEPRIFYSKTRLTLPLKGRILVHDGHDFSSHHRRFNLAHPFLREIGVTHNFTRYASDLCVVNAKGDLRRSRSDANTDWYGFGVIVYAPGAGRIARARGDVADNINGKSTFTLDQFRKDPATPAGNYVIIDHLNGEFSLIAHLKQGSVLVKAGDTVRPGQPIGQMGVSGDAYLPHVHYELRSASTVNAEAFPAYFNNFVRLLGSRRIRVARSPIDSGDLLENR